jgi:hypothetical protein
MAMYYKEKENTSIRFIITNTALDVLSPYDYIDAMLKNKEIETFFTSIVKFNYYSIDVYFTSLENNIDYILYLIEKDENADKDILDFNSFVEQKDNETVKTK